MRDVLQSTARKFKIFMADSSTPTTGKTGLSSFTVYLAKDGIAESTVAPSIEERGHGWYEITPTTAHRDTLGESAWTFVASGAVDFVMKETVVAVDGQTVRYGAAAAGDAMTLTAGQRVKLDAAQTDYAPLLASGYTAPANSTIASIYTLLQLTDSDVASIVALLGTPAGASIAADLAAIKLSTDEALRPIVAGRQLAVDAAGAVALDSARQQTLADLAAMITSSGTPEAKFTAPALSLAPSGGGGGLTTEQATQLSEIHGAIFPVDPEEPPVVILPGPIGTTTGWAVCVSKDGVAEAGVACTCKLSSGPPGDVGRWFDGATSIAATSASNGVVQFPGLIAGCTYIFGRGTNGKISFRIPSDHTAESIQVPSLATA